jgi:hypothetical protein
MVLHVVCVMSPPQGPKTNLQGLKSRRTAFTQPVGAEAFAKPTAEPTAEQQKLMDEAVTEMLKEETDTHEGKKQVAALLTRSRPSAGQG